MNNIKQNSNKFEQAIQSYQIAINGIITKTSRDTQDKRTYPFASPLISLSAHWETEVALADLIPPAS